MANELKPCPFCGAVPVLRDDHIAYPDQTWVECHGCGIEQRELLPPKEAIALWNTRTESSQ